MGVVHLLQTLAAAPYGRLDIRNWAPGDMRNWTPLLLRCGDGGGLVQVVHGRDPRAAPRPHAAGGAARGRGLWAHVGKPGSHALLRPGRHRSEEHTSELQSLMRISYAVF